MVGCFQVATTCKTVADPEVVELDAWEDWTPEMQMHYALFKITTSPQGDPSELMVHHKVCKTKATGSDYSANTVTGPPPFKTLFWAARTWVRT